MVGKLGGDIKSEPSKWLPIIVSAMALGVSFLSWCESHRSRLINEAVNRPFLAVDVTAKTDTLAIAREHIYVFVDTKIANSGKVPATFSNLQREFVFLGPLGQCAVREEKPDYSMIEGKEILPSFDLTAHDALQIPSGCDREEIRFFFQGSVNYSDPNGNRYSQDFSKLLWVHTTPDSVPPTVSPTPKRKKK